MIGVVPSNCSLRLMVPCDAKVPFINLLGKATVYCCILFFVFAFTLAVLIVTCHAMTFHFQLFNFVVVTYCVI